MQLQQTVHLRDSVQAEQARRQEMSQATLRFNKELVTSVCVCVCVCVCVSPLCCSALLLSATVARDICAHSACAHRRTARRQRRKPSEMLSLHRMPPTSRAHIIAAYSRRTQQRSRVFLLPASRACQRLSVSNIVPHNLHR